MDAHLRGATNAAHQSPESQYAAIARHPGWQAQGPLLQQKPSSKVTICALSKGPHSSSLLCSDGPCSRRLSRAALSGTPARTPCTGHKASVALKSVNVWLFSEMYCAGSLTVAL